MKVKCFETLVFGDNRVQLTRILELPFYPRPQDVLLFDHNSDKYDPDVFTVTESFYMADDGIVEVYTRDYQCSDAEDLAILSTVARERGWT